MEFSPMTAQYGPESGATVNPGPGLSPAAYGGTLPHRWPPLGTERSVTSPERGIRPCQEVFRYGTRPARHWHRICVEVRER